MADFVVVAIVILIVAAAVTYIVKEKKKGVKCIGCPSGTNCSGNCHCNDSFGK